VTAEKTVSEVCEQEYVAGSNLVGLLSRGPPIPDRYAFGNTPANRFSFFMRGNVNIVSAPDQSAIATQADLWDATREACGQTWISAVNFGWSAPALANVFIQVVPGLTVDGDPANGSFEALSCPNSWDCLRLNDSRPNTTMAHEIGHALGFLDSVGPLDIMCSDEDVNVCINYDLRAVFAWHIRKLIDAYF
jgi:hypothetical protein